MYVITVSESIGSELQAALYANWSSLVFDWIVRQKLSGSNMSFYLVKQLPIFRPSFYSANDLQFIVPRVLELTFVARDLNGWAADLGYSQKPFNYDTKRRAKIRAELDAYFAYLFRLSRDELRYILDPADIMGAEYPSESFRVLKNKEMNEYGEYRTQRLVLEAWDKLEAGELH